MSEHEFYKERVVIHHDAAHPHEHVVREDYVEDAPTRVEHIYYDDGERRQDVRSRGVVREEILSFRRGVYLVLDIVEGLLVIEFLLKLFSVSAANPFAAFMDAITYPFVAPFGSLVSWITPYVAVNWSILIALIAYGLFAYLLIALFESGIRAAYRR
jgi:uncharacterized protein YggT (Ycf19 family)